MLALQAQVLERARQKVIGNFQGYLEEDRENRERSSGRESAASGAGMSNRDALCALPLQMLEEVPW